jgi:hypothetical protein
MTDVILSLSTTYTRLTYEKFDFNGKVYSEPAARTLIRGVLIPLTSEERIALQGLGQSSQGKMNFYVPVSEGRLTDHDSILDTQGVEWFVIPYDADYSDLVALVKYRLERKVL